MEVANSIMITQAFPSTASYLSIYSFAFKLLKISNVLKIGYQLLHIHKLSFDKFYHFLIRLICIGFSAYQISNSLQIANNSLNSIII